MGDTVLGIDIDAAAVAALNGEISSALEADAADAKALAECELDAYDVVIISIGENIEASVLAAMNVMEAGCKNVWVKAQSDTHYKILKAIGVHHIVSPEKRYGEHIAQIIHNPIVKDFLSFGDGNYIVEIDVKDLPSMSKAIDTKHLAAHNVKCIGVYKDAELRQPADVKGLLEGGMTVLLFGTRANLRKVADRLS